MYIFFFSYTWLRNTVTFYAHKSEVFTKCTEGYLDESRPANISRCMTLHNDVYKILAFFSWRSTL